MMLTQHVIAHCTLQPSPAQGLLSCSLGISKHVQTEHLLSPPHRMFKHFIDLSLLKDAQPGFFSQGVLCLYKAEIQTLLCEQNVNITSFQPVVGWVIGPSWNLSNQAHKLRS